MKTWLISDLLFLTEFAVTALYQ